ncbi:MAG: (Fe-S)-binding protein [Thermodesulfovibrionales bacterium]|nr:(Fe-S)-binding protein [Thermodesulfovibrionales bacterium]
MKEIIKELKELEELIMRCMKCGSCQSVCPLYRSDLKEQSVTRSKLAQIESIYEGKLKDTGKILKYIDYCLLCGRCKVNCPSGVKVDEIFLRAKTILRKIEKMKGWQKLILSLAMERPELMGKLAPFMHIALKFSSKKIKNDIYKPIFKDLSERHLFGIKRDPFTKSFAGLQKAQREKSQVLFYPGCAVQYIFPQIGEALVRILNYYDVSVLVPDLNRCCGVPAASMGDLELYKKMVNENLDFFESTKMPIIITCCPTCEYGLKDLGFRITGRAFSGKIIDILIFLEENLELDIVTSLKGKMSLHLPCHYDTHKSNLPSKFLNDHIKADYVTLDNQDCCGFGGTFNLKFYKKSKAISLPKAEEIKAKKIDYLFTPCPGCIMQLTDALISAQANTEVFHPIEKIYEEIKKRN